MNPYTNKIGKMVRVQLHMWPEEKVKLQKNAIKHNGGNLSAEVRSLIK